MLPSLLRYPLRQDSEFFQRAHALRSSYWTFLWSFLPENQSDKTSQSKDSSPAPFPFAIIVKKTVARGTEKSKLKRKLRGVITHALEALLPHQTGFKSSESLTDRSRQRFVVVLIPRRQAISATKEELTQDLKTGLTLLLEKTHSLS